MRFCVIIRVLGYLIRLAQIIPRDERKNGCGKTATYHLGLYIVKQENFMTGKFPWICSSVGDAQEENVTNLG